jgi:4a-hydroxytetrahydrobiopterin dehydratase
MPTQFPRPSESLLSLAASHCSAGAAKLTDDVLATRLSSLTGWSETGDRIEKTYRFASYYETIGFVNALAWIANREDHHPDLTVSYNRCVVTWSTHDAGGVTENDVICAAKTDRLLAG